MLRCNSKRFEQSEKKASHERDLVPEIRANLRGERLKCDKQAKTWPHWHLVYLTSLNILRRGAVFVWVGMSHIMMMTPWNGRNFCYLHANRVWWSVLVSAQPVHWLLPNRSLQFMALVVSGIGFWNIAIWGVSDVSRNVCVLSVWLPYRVVSLNEGMYFFAFPFDLAIKHRDATRK